jgi:hypothetical protein
VGLISYPLYLFHWPALSFVHIVKGDVQRGHVPKPIYLVDALIVSLLLAVLTYYFIERNARHNKSKWTIAILLGLFVITGITGYLISEGCIPSHYNPPQLAKLNIAASDADMMAGVQEVKKHRVYFKHKIGGCGSQTIFLGDSNMQHYAPRILELLKENHGNERGAILVTECGVPPIPDTRNNQGKESSELLAGFSEEIESNPRIDRVVIASRWCTYFSPNSKWRTDGLSLDSKEGKYKALSKLDLFLQSIAQQGKIVYIILNIPTGTELDPKGIYPRNFRGSGESKRKVLTKESFLNENSILLGQIAAIAKKNGAEVIDPLDYLCTNGVCIAEDENGIPIRFDDGHLRPGYVREHVKYLDRTVEP